MKIPGKNSYYFSGVAPVPIPHLYRVMFKIYGEIIQDEYSHVNEINKTLFSKTQQYYLQAVQAGS